MQPEKFNTFCNSLAEELSRSIRRSRATNQRGEVITREHLADELAARTGHRITPYTIHSWTSRAGKHRWLPLAYAVLICELVDDFTLFAVALGSHAETVARLVREGKGRAPETKKRRKVNVRTGTKPAR